MYSTGVTLLMFCRSHFRRTFTKFNQSGISRGQPPILEYLLKHDGCIQNEIARSCNIEPATATSILTNMERAGFITRCANENDRRVWQICLTDSGRAAAERVQSIHAELADEAMSGFTDEEAKAALSYLNRMIKNLDKCENTSCKGED